MHDSTCYMESMLLIFHQVMNSIQQLHCNSTRSFHDLAEVELHIVCLEPVHVTMALVGTGWHWKALGVAGCWWVLLDAAEKWYAASLGCWDVSLSKWGPVPSGVAVVELEPEEWYAASLGVLITA